MDALLTYLAMFPILWFLIYRNTVAGHGTNVWYFAVSAILSIIAWLVTSFALNVLGIKYPTSAWVSSIISLGFYVYMLKLPLLKGVSNNTKKIIESITSTSGFVFLIFILAAILIGGVADEPYPRY